MADNLKAISSDIKFNLITDHEINDQIEKIYEMGYRAGVLDQKRVSSHSKVLNTLLYSWLIDQLEQFSYFTKRYEYKFILEEIVKCMDQYLSEYKLTSTRKLRNFVVIEDGAESTINTKKELSYVLAPVMEKFIEGEEEKQRRERERKELENQNK
jgi:hypothetical protein